MNKLNYKNSYLVLIIILVVIIFLPFFTSFNNISKKDNDLGRNYLPLFSYLSESYKTNNNLPLWRSDQMMGETMIGSPLLSPVYPLNYLFKVLNVKTALLFYIYLHFILCGVSTFYLAKSFKLKNIEAFAAAIFYSFSVKLLSHLGAGHITMVAAFCYFPLIFLSLKKLNTKNYIFLPIGSFSLALTYILYPTIFYYIFIFILFYQLITVVNIKKRKYLFQIIVASAIFILLAIGLCSVVLFPQLEFSNFSTRSTMTLSDVAIPTWSLKKFVFAFVTPYVIPSLNHEELLYVGIVPLVLSVVAFLGYSKKKKFFSTIAVFTALTIAAGTSTFVYEILYNHFPLLKYSRVTTRFWFIVSLFFALAAAQGLEKIKKPIKLLLIFIFILETMTLSLINFSNTKSLSFREEKMYQDLSKDKELFRVYCTTYCFNPQLLQKYEIEILNGENPIQQSSFINFLSSAGGYQFNNFAVIFPPYQVWQTEKKPEPNAKVLGDANVKYVVSTYPLDNKFKLIGSYNNYLVYLNSNFQPRFRFIDSDNRVSVNYINESKIILSFVKSDKTRTLLISQNFIPGWEAIIEEKVMRIPEGSAAQVVVYPNTQKVILEYKPTSFKIGLYLSLFTLFVSIILFAIFKIKGKWQK